MKKPIFPYLILFVALLVSGSAAFYSVFGLAKLFSGAYVNVIIMAGSLEIAKLVTTAYLHRYWKELGRTLKYYLITAVLILAVITSGGIYGFLSSAYQVTATKDKFHTEKVNLLSVKKSRFEKNLEELKIERDQINLNIQTLSKSLGTDNQTQTIDRRTGQVLTSIQSSSKKGVQNQLTSENGRRELLISRIDNLQDSIQTYEVKIIDANANNDAASELGPLKYLSELTGFPMNKVVNIFLLLLIFVFDPLAITLIVAALRAFEIESNKNSNESGDLQAKSELERNTPPSNVEAASEDVAQENLESARGIEDVIAEEIEMEESEVLNPEEDVVIGSLFESSEKTPKKRGRPRGSKTINRKSPTDGIKRTITETLTPDVAEKMAKNLPQNKKKV